MGTHTPGAHPQAMAADDLFGGLPPPSTASPAKLTSPTPGTAADPVQKQPALKSALKRSKPTSSSHAPTPADAAHIAVDAPAPKSALKRSHLSASSPSRDPVAAPPAAADNRSEEANGKRIRFRTTVDASETQVIEAMQKISMHIRNPSKFSKASKLALQLIQAGSVKPETSDKFFAVLEAAMSSPSACYGASVRADYQALFTASQDAAEFFDARQKNQFAIWTLKAVLANDLFTDDSFVFNKAIGKIKEAILELPKATAHDDTEEAAALATAESTSSAAPVQEDTGLENPALELKGEASDPFGLDTLISAESKKSGKSIAKQCAALNSKTEEDEQRRFLRLRREAIVQCLEIAARRYKLPWTQTAIDIFAKHAFDNVHRFTRQQRDAIEKLWASVKEQQIRRKQGKSVNGKLDVNAFEFLQAKYSQQKISIRHAVGGGGDRRAETWLG